MTTNAPGPRPTQAQTIDITGIGGDTDHVADRTEEIATRDRHDTLEIAHRPAHAEPGSPGDAVASGGPAASVDPGQPDSPVDPVDPVDPDQPDSPVGPVGPVGAVAAVAAPAPYRRGPNPGAIALGLACLVLAGIVATAQLGFFTASALPISVGVTALVVLVVTAWTVGRSRKRRRHSRRAHCLHRPHRLH